MGKHWLASLHRNEMPGMTASGKQLVSLVEARAGQLYTAAYLPRHSRAAPPTPPDASLVADGTSRPANR